MEKLPIPAFSHRENRDGTIDSICPKCFATIATSSLESELEQKEHEHHCDTPAAILFNQLQTEIESITDFEIEDTGPRPTPLNAQICDK